MTTKGAVTSTWYIAGLSIPDEEYHNSTLTRQLVSSTEASYGSTNFGEFSVGTKDPNDLTHFVDMSYDIIQYGDIVLMPLGLLGNFLVMFVLWSIESKMSTTYMFLLNLTTTDFMYCMFQLSRSAPFFEDTDLIHKSTTWCQLWYYCVRSLKFISVWTLVGVTTERVLMVYWPLKIKMLVTRKRTLIAIIVIDIFGFLTSIYILWVYRNHPTHTIESLDEDMSNSCSGNPSPQNTIIYMLATHFRSREELCLLFAIPCILIFFSNTAIIYKLHQKKIQRSRLSRYNMNISIRDYAKSQSTSVLLVTVSFIYLLLTGPYYISLFIWQTDPFVVSIDKVRDAIACLELSICIILMHFQVTINFVLYCMSGTLFRSQMKLSFVKLCRTTHHTNIGSPSLLRYQMTTQCQIPKQEQEEENGNCQQSVQSIESALSSTADRQTELSVPSLISTADRQS